MSLSKPIVSQLCIHIIEKYWQASSERPSGRHPASSYWQPSSRQWPLSRQCAGPWPLHFCVEAPPSFSHTTNRAKASIHNHCPFFFFPVSQATGSSYTINDIKPLEHSKSCRINPEQLPFMSLVRSALRKETADKISPRPLLLIVWPWHQRRQHHLGANTETGAPSWTYWIQGYLFTKLSVILVHITVGEMLTHPQELGLWTLPSCLYLWMKCPSS